MIRVIARQLLQDLHADATSNTVKSEMKLMQEIEKTALKLDNLLTEISSYHGLLRRVALVCRFHKQVTGRTPTVIAHSTPPQRDSEADDGRDIPAEAPSRKPSSERHSSEHPRVEQSLDDPDEMRRIYEGWDGIELAEVPVEHNDWVLVDQQEILSLPLKFLRLGSSAILRELKDHVAGPGQGNLYRRLAGGPPLVQLGSARCRLRMAVERIARPASGTY